MCSLSLSFFLSPSGLPSFPVVDHWARISKRSARAGAERQADETCSVRPRPSLDVYGVASSVELPTATPTSILLGRSIDWERERKREIDRPGPWIRSVRVRHPGNNEVAFPGDRIRALRLGVAPIAAPFRTIQGSKRSILRSRSNWSQTSLSILFLPFVCRCGVRDVRKGAYTPSEGELVPSSRFEARWNLQCVNFIPLQTARLFSNTNPLNV